MYFLTCVSHSKLLPWFATEVTKVKQTLVLLQCNDLSHSQAGLRMRLHRTYMLYCILNNILSVVYAFLHDPEQLMILFGV